jgi:23S rRNA (adenine2503-C2)-methyltransferase
MQNIFSQRFDEIESFVSERNQQSFRSNQIWKGLYQHFYNDWNAFSNLPLVFKEMLEAKFSLVNIKLLDSSNSEDYSSEKLLYELNDGNLIESVVLSNNKRNTLCISTQSGCPVGCVFCATGEMGFQRNLTSGEIIEQVVNYYRLSPDNYTNLGNIVLMGMGEPFLNYHNVINAIRILNDHHGLNIGARRITVSTIGIIDKIRRFAQENFQVNLAVSLHAPTDETREKLVPITKSNPIHEIIQACEYYYEMTKR